MTDRKFFKDRVDAVNASQVEVEVNSPFSWVDIKAGGSEGVFLQGHEADEFIDTAKKVWEELQDVTEDDCWKYLAYDFLETL